MFNANHHFLGVLISIWRVRKGLGIRRSTRLACQRRRLGAGGKRKRRRRYLSSKMSGPSFWAPLSSFTEGCAGNLVHTEVAQDDTNLCAKGLSEHNLQTNRSFIGCVFIVERPLALNLVIFGSPSATVHAARPLLASRFVQPFSVTLRRRNQITLIYLTLMISRTEVAKCNRGNPHTTQQ